MFLIKNTYKDLAGNTRQAAKWTVCFTDSAGAQRHVVAFENKRASEELGRQLEKLVSHSIAGTLPAELQRWLESLPSSIRARLATWGLLSGVRVSAGRTLQQHIADWVSYLDSKGRSAKHLLHCKRHVERIAEAQGLTYWHEFTATAVVNFLSKLKADDSSARTRNSILPSAKSFSKWMNTDGRASADPLAYLKEADTRTDKRHVRRALSPDEIGWLLDTTEAEPDRHGLTGADRSLLYRLCIETGLRASEAASLTRENFNLAGKPPVVTVAASLTKNRQGCDAAAEGFDRGDADAGSRCSIAEGATIQDVEVSEIRRDAASRPRRRPATLACRRRRGRRREETP